MKLTNLPNKPKTKKCASCKKPFEMSRYTTLQKYCSPECAYTASQKRAKKARMAIKRVKSDGDVEWAVAVKDRDGHRCRYCGKTEYLNSHHIFSRSNRTVRHDLSNGITLCAGCHTLSNHSAHKAPADFICWLIEQNGQEWFDNLRLKANSIMK